MSVSAFSVVDQRVVPATGELIAKRIGVYSLVRVPNLGFYFPLFPDFP